MARLWFEILRRANGHALFHEPILMVSGYDLKVYMQRETAIKVQVVFLNYLNNYYNMREEIMPVQEAWLDFSIKDILINLDLANGITLLYKSLYLKY